jgi:hypothetical protein
MASVAPNVYGVARAVWDDPDFADEPYTEREAWLWLIAQAQWRDGKIRGNTGNPVNLTRGEFSISIRYMATKWKWTKDRAHRFIKRLEKRGTISDTSRDTSQIYFINKYNNFQVVGIPKRDSDRDSSATAARQQRDKRETGKQGNRETSSLRSDTCAEAASGSTPEAPKLDFMLSEPSSPEFIKIPTNRFRTTGEEVGITEVDISDYERTYPAVDVRQEIRAMRRWAMDNPTGRKTATGIKRFVNSWLSRAQNKGQRNGSGNHYNGQAGQYPRGSFADSISIAAAERARERVQAGNGAGDDGTSAGPITDEDRRSAIDA